LSIISIRNKNANPYLFPSYSVAITCLILAAKFYCETEDIVVNIDIARAIGLGSGILDGLQKLNAMEAKMLDLLDFNLFVCIKDYNKVQNFLNEKVKKAKEAQNEIRK